MADLLVLIGGPLIAWLVTSRWSMTLPQASPKRRRNYRGIDVPTACGITVVAGILAALAWVAFAGAIWDSPLADRAAASAPAFAAAVAGFALLGAWDDLAGSEGIRGWRAHLASLGSGRPSSGAIKLTGGVLYAFILTARTDLLLAFLAAGVLAGSANLFNLLDVRPGRALKFWLVIVGVAAVVLAATGHTGPAMCALCAAAAVIGFLPHDLAERAMLGDVGANAVGAVAGATLIAFGDVWVAAVVLLVLLVIHAFADRPGLSKMIDAVPPLRAFDRAGRAPS